MASIYLGGSRSAINITTAITPIISTIIASGARIHVGCQYGADQMVVYYTPATSLSVFAVAESLRLAPSHVQQAAHNGASVTLAAGGTSTHIPARYLLRSIAAFRGCEQAAFFSPGLGSLAVMREFAKTNKPIFAFTHTQPAPIPSTAGAWLTVWFAGFQCFGWGYPSNQYKLF